MSATACSEIWVPQPEKTVEIDPEAAKNFLDIVGGRPVDCKDVGLIDTACHIGGGYFAEAFSARVRKTKKDVAVKVARYNNVLEKGYIDNEVEILHKIKDYRHSCQYVVQFYESFPLGDTMCFLFEMLGESLTSVSHIAHRAPLVQKIGIQLLEAIAFLHRMHVVHGDIKSRNICFTLAGQYSIKLIDFGCSRDIPYIRGRTGDNDFCSVPYRPPEVLLGLPMDERIDIFSAGVVLAQLFTGRNMFPTKNVFQLAQFQFAMNIVPKKAEKATFYDLFYNTMRNPPIPFTNHELAIRKISMPADMRDMLITKIRDLLIFGPNGRRSPTPRFDLPEDQELIQVLEMMLCPDLANRAYADDAIDMPFFTHRF